MSFGIVFNFCGLQRSPQKNPLLEQSMEQLEIVLKDNSFDTARVAGQLKGAFELADKNFDKRHDSLVAWVCRLEGNAFFQINNNLAARYYYMKGLQYGARSLPKTDDIICRLFRNTALTFRETYDFKSALTYYDSINIISTDSFSMKWKMQDLLGMAKCYKDINEPASAEGLYNQALQLASHYLTKAGLADAYFQLSACLKTEKKYVQSIQRARKGIEILEPERTVNKHDSVILETGYLFLANTLKAQGQYNGAEKSYLHAVRLSESLKDTNRISAAMMGLGINDRFQNKFAASEQTLTKGLKLIAYKGELSPFLAALKEKYFTNRSETRLAAKNFTAAIADQDSAIAMLTKYGDDPTLNSDLKNDRDNLPSIMTDQASAYMALYDQKVDMNGYIKAKIIFDSLPAVLTDARANYIGEPAKLDLAENAKPSFEKAISLCLILYQREKDKKYLNAAFDFAEQSKSMILFDNVRLNSRLPDSLQKERKAVSQLEADLSSSKDAEALQHLLSRKRNVVEKIKAFTVVQKTSVPDIQRNLLKDGRSALIEYFVGDSAVYAFGITANDISVHKIPKSPDFEQMLTIMRESAIQQNNEAFASLSYSFYKLLLDSLLSPLAVNVHRLIIIPDGSLNYVAFESLLQRPPAFAPSIGFSLKGADFLIRKYAVSYAPSANLLLEQTTRRPTSASSDFAAFAPAYRPRDTVGGKYVLREALSRDGAYDLPNAKKEAQEVGALLHGKIYSDENATETTFKQQAEHYKILHLAMHAVANERDPADSRLLFTLPDNDKKKGAGDLTMAELSALSLNADMAVLSACNTGFGKWSKGEGVMSLARAFQQAGVRSTVMSLWKAPDEQTKEIMIDFYKNLKSGMAKDEALQKAKVDFMYNAKMDKESSPFYWATFVLSGDADPLIFENAGRKKMIWASAILGLLLSGLFFLRNFLNNNKIPVKISVTA